MKVGIDLGTTNSAVAWIDPRESEGAEFPPIHILDIPQAVSDRAVESRRTLPSFLFLGDKEYVGEYAREQGAVVPTRLVHSAKSWLSNPDVDRMAKVLPWEAQEGGRVLSPVEVSSRFLAEMRAAFDKQHSSSIAEHEVVLTVPASFDEEARELTVMAAREAGIEKLTLLEEPAAAFYSWIANHLAHSRKSLFDGQSVLVVDVGGGTSDFTLIRVTRSGDQIDFTRTAVGRHLLLGGDNLDLTLAWLVETKLGKPLSVRQRSALRRQCSAAKERLLSDPSLKALDITVLGGGSSLIGGTLRTEILREEALELALDGFLPVCGLDERPQEDKKSAFRELGLPYCSDAAITRHLAAFLASAGAPAPDAILFNGGFFIPEVCRTRVVDVVEHWYGKRPAVFENHDLDLAVAVGAAYYSFARTSETGVLVRGGLPRSYYIGIAAELEAIRAVCLMPRGTEEGAVCELDDGNLQLVANKPVSFKLYSSLVRTEDVLGQVVDFPSAGDDPHRHAPLAAVIRFGKPAGERLVPVKLSARLTEVGTLEIWCESKLSEHRWRLQFELRKAVTADAPKPARPAAVVADDALAKAEDLIAATLLRGELTPEELPGRLESALALGRGSWPVGAIRRLADRILEHAKGRTLSAAHEIRWLNLGGFCLRPGFGFPGDDLRMEQARRVYAQTLAFPNQTQNQVEWWIFWGRVAGGLNRNQQTDIYQRLSPYLLPRGKPQRLNTSLLREMWRAASALELLPAAVRTDLGDALLKRLRAGDPADSDFWCLARLGARVLFYGPLNQVLSAATATRWIDGILKLPRAGETLASLARRTGNVTIDVPAATFEAVRRRLEAESNADRLLRVLEGEEERDLETMGRVFGEDLPSGLVFANPADE